MSVLRRVRYPFASTLSDFCFLDDWDDFVEYEKKEGLLPKSPFRTKNNILTNLKRFDYNASKKQDISLNK
jgi:hypothetical protein